MCFLLMNNVVNVYFVYQHTIDIVVTILPINVSLYCDFVVRKNKNPDQFDIST